MGNKSTAQHYENASKTGVLTLVNFDLKELPHNLIDLHQILRTLNLSKNKLSEIPPFISVFLNLKQLKLDQNRLQHLPPEIGALQKLETLSISQNRLIDLPESMADLTALKNLNLSSNKLTVFPMALCRLKNLDVLDLSQNQIAELPDGIQTLSVIELNLNRNQLSLISENIAHCQRLKVLRVEENCLPLLVFTPTLLRNSQLTVLAVEGNLFDMNDFRQLEGYEEFLHRAATVKKKMY